MGYNQTIFHSLKKKLENGGIIFEFFCTKPQFFCTKTEYYFAELCLFFDLNYNGAKNPCFERKKNACKKNTLFDFKDGYGVL